MTSAPANELDPQPIQPRLMSIDALRGFDMLWIVGAGGIVKALAEMRETPWTTFLKTQLTHVKWEGFRFYDLIFPLFLFIVGVSIVFSLEKALTRQHLAAVLGRILRRSLLLFAIGVFYYGGLSKPWPDVNLGGVLHRIAACYLFASLIYVLVRHAKGLAVVAVILLLGYWGMVAWIPFPDLKLERQVIERIAAEIGDDSPSAIAATVEARVRGTLEEGHNLVNFIDFLYLPGKKAQRYYINEGLLSTIPAVALTLMGVLAGLLLKDPRTPAARKVLVLLIAGVVGIVLAYLWGFSFPWIKRLWTSSFILLTAGMSSILLAVFYWAIDIRGWRRWCQPFVWVGANALTVYVMASIVSFEQLASRLVGGDIQIFLDRTVGQGFGGLVIAIVGLLMVIGVMRFLYLKNCFIRV